MEQHERELLIYSIRSGIIIKNGLKIIPPTIEQCLEAAAVFKESFDELKSQGVMTEREIVAWMRSEGLWHKVDDDDVKKLKDSVDQAKVDIYNNRYDKKEVRRHKHILRTAKKLLGKKHGVRTSYFTNSCEGLSGLEKTAYLISQTTYKDNALYNFEEYSISDVISFWNEGNLLEPRVRELARNEPWRTIWASRDISSCPLFIQDNNKELTFTQKNLVIWSKLYDNIQEHMEAPPEEVVNDDDMLDGWFIVQNRKREKDKKEKDVDSTLGANAGKDEVFVMANASDKERLKAIKDMNDGESVYIRDERMAYVQQKGEVDRIKLPDVQRELSKQMIEQMKGRGRG